MEHWPYALRRSIQALERIYIDNKQGKRPRPALVCLSGTKLRLLPSGSSENVRQKKTIKEISRKATGKNVERAGEGKATKDEACFGYGVPRDAQKIEGDSLLCKFDFDPTHVDRHVGLGRFRLEID
ncbi:hypothetical protein Fot_28843 [Forsythia ovata]|uniref:Uncharacterized protein n=1 Tax=Forsythia ovata TaxID=205694 RepID=A0ABD1TQ64_9LAMI